MGRPDTKTLFFLGLILAASGLVSPPVALLGGIAFGFVCEHPYRRESARLAQFLLQASVVALGFGMNLREVLHAGRSGLLYSAIGIALAMALGLLLGAALKVSGRASFLITAGTAICGGSAIAAVAPISNASEEEISVAMGTVFLLNSVALLLFPAVGGALHLSQNQFGLWAALAIHDTSSVVGATAKYGAQALSVGTTVKLARALWIVPVSLLTAAFTARLARGGAQQTSSGERAGAPVRVKVPWFILLFCAAAAANTCLPELKPQYKAFYGLGKEGLVTTLFLIGSALSKQTLRQVGPLPLVQGVVLWVVVGSASLFAICHGYIAI